MFNNSSPGYSYCEHLRPDIAILPDWAAAETAYETAYFGKWHIGPAEDLFKSRFNHTHPRPDQDDLPFLNSSHWHPSTGLAPLVKSFANGRAGTLALPMERFPDVAAADYTRYFLRNARSGGRPFCAFCAFPGPHSPWMVPDSFGIRYDPARIKPWANRKDGYAGKPYNQIKLSLLDKLGSSQSDRDSELRDLLACLFSYMELIDEQVGAVIGELKRTGLYDNTMIIFTADHGDMAGAHGFLSKGSYMYDETYRIPLIVRMPGTAKMRRIGAPVHLMDVTATLMHVMRGEETNAMATHALQGLSLMPLLTDRNSWPRSIHYAEYHGDWYGHYSARMVTDGKWKLVWNLSDFSELYDLENDPLELANLFYSPACKSTRERYFKILAQEATRLEDRHLALLDPSIEEQCMALFKAGFKPIHRD